MLGNLRISHKLLVMIGLSVLGIAGMAAMGLSALWGNLMEDRKAKLQDVVLLARQALDLDYQASKKAGLSEADSIEQAKVLIRTFRFGKDDYFYAIDAKGVAVANPNPKVEGKNLYDAADSDGVLFVRRQLEIAASGGGFLSYRFPRAAGGDPLPKTSYAVEFKPFKWVIGAGMYLDDVNAIFWSQALTRGILIGVALLVIGGLFLLLSRSIVSPISAMIFCDAEDCARRYVDFDSGA